MEEKIVIDTDKAPGAIGPYSQAVRVDNLLFTSGQLPVDPTTGTLLEGSIADCTHQVIKNLAAVIEAAGGTLSDVVKTTVYLADLANFQEVNAVYAEYFSEPFPARSAFQVAALPLGAGIEVEAVVHIK